MKIGIITWFTGPNYGTNLQAIALQAFLRKLKYSVEIINYEVDAPRNRGFIKRILAQPQKYINLRVYKKYAAQIKIRNEKLKAAISNNCVLTEHIKCGEDFIDKCNEFDLLIFGGDQIWNPNWYHRFYYADYDEITTRRISYAPSIGVDKIPANQMDNMARSLNKFDCISVREEKGAAIVSNLLQGRKKIESVVDPVFLLSESEWDEVFNIQAERKSGRYVLSMFLTDNRHHWKAAEQFAQKIGSRQVIVPYCGFSYMQRADIVADAGLEDLLSLIKGAEYVLTDSFHITVLAILYRRQFYTFQRFRESEFTSTNERVRNLLSIAGCEERFIEYGTKHIRQIKKIEYDEVVPRLNEEINKSTAYLKNAIEGK